MRPNEILVLQEPTREDSRMTFGLRLRTLLQELDIGTNDFDRMIGRKVGYTSKLTTGKRGSRLPADTFDAIVRAIKANPEYLRTGRGPHFLEPGSVTSIDADQMREQVKILAASRVGPDELRALDTVQVPPNVEPTFDFWLRELMLIHQRKLQLDQTLRAEAIDVQAEPDPDREEIRARLDRPAQLLLPEKRKRKSE